jgi:hypothetical protein
MERPFPRGISTNVVPLFSEARVDGGFPSHDRALRATRRSLTAIGGSAHPLKAGFVILDSARNWLDGNRR